MQGGNRVAVITGAGSGSGIGFATATYLAELGVRVAILATTERIHQRRQELENMGYSALSLMADLTDWRQVQNSFQEVASQWGHIDILVNNAGMAQVNNPELSRLTWEYSDEEWDQEINRNLKIPFLCVRAAVPLLKTRAAGRIINVASVTGPLVANPLEAPYAAAKSGLMGLTRVLALELAEFNITVNAVAPGWISTGSSTPRERVAGRYSPLKRPGTPREVASAIAWLSSPDASYVTGQMIVVDGGNSVVEDKSPQ
ncbi:MAG: short-chain dehydrogenase [Sulfobacillus benefaciens]|uniref:Short-chain dehydrogenase n=1 Tax=Sulfobacillus benefaciens TaxID=453960 RepID=A0A2T2X705_9FIRM|nr:MAG: short-chain dehydrogenase [Sulfobacillus benefaciens]